MMNQLYQLSLGKLLNSKKFLSRLMANTFLLSIISLTAFSQSISVSGKVIDSKSDGLPGVTVQLKGTSNATATDIEGNYSLSNVPSNGTLVYSFVGTISQEIAVNNRKMINVTLADDTQSLEEIVVVGYGTQKRKEISGTVTSLGAKDFNVGLNTNPLAAAAGKVAGLVITQSSGDPNAAPTVRLRGTGSLTAGSSPLYVIDGVVGAPIENVNPNDIMTFDVLRDASSAAIYGARGQTV